MYSKVLYFDVSFDHYISLLRYVGMFMYNIMIMFSDHYPFIVDTMFRMKLIWKTKIVTALKQKISITKYSHILGAS